MRLQSGRLESPGPATSSVGDGPAFACSVAVIGTLTVQLAQPGLPQQRALPFAALELLAGVPTVVYGYFAALTLAPMIRDAAVAVGITSASTESALAAGIVMGVMIIPFVSSMADDSMAAVPAAMRDGSLAMGATRSETIARPRPVPPDARLRPGSVR